MIELKNISKFFSEKKAVDQVSFTVKEGENLVLLGTSGCGKTTTLKLINGLETPSEGAVFFNGKNIDSFESEVLRKNMGYVLQNIGLFPHYTIEENIAVVPKLNGWESAKIKERTAILLEKLHLNSSQLKMYPRELSGGQQQRVGLARALAANPPVLLMDEPFGALDNVTRGKIHADFLNLDELQTKTIVMVTHDVQEAFTLADRICLMNNGKVVQIGTPKELLFSPADDFAKTFLNAQRLALQFRVTKLTDLFEFFPISNGVSAETTSSKKSVWSAMESLKERNENRLTCGDGKRKFSFDFGQLMQAFDSYQKSNNK